LFLAPRHFTTFSTYNMYYTSVGNGAYFFFVIFNLLSIFF
jgi:hypothetical protein